MPHIVVITSFYCFFNVVTGDDTLLLFKIYPFADPEKIFTIIIDFFQQYYAHNFLKYL